MKFLQVGPRQFVNPEKIIALFFNSKEMKPMVVVAGLGTLACDDQLDDIVKRLKKIEEGGQIHEQQD